jgi:predicted nucleotidyltransferase
MHSHLTESDCDSLGPVFSIQYSQSMTINPSLTVADDELGSLCRRWQVRELSIFGSALRGDFAPTSDVDVLVSFAADAPWSLWDLTRMRDELTELFGRPIDLVEREGLRNPFRKQRILSTRQVVYVARE